MNLKDDEIVSATGLNDEEYVTIFTDKKTAKRIKTSDLEETGRAKRGNALMKKVKTSPYQIKACLVTNSKTEIMLINEDGSKEIKNSEIPIMDLQSTGSAISKKDILYALKKQELEKATTKEINNKEKENFNLEDFKL